MEVRGWGRLVSDPVSRDDALMRGTAVFPEIDALPGAQREPAMVDGNGNVDRRQGSPDVGWHVVIAFGRMNEKRIAIRNKPGEEFLEIASHIRIGIFLDEQRGRSMAKVQSKETLIESVFGEPRCHLLSQFIEAASARGNVEFMEGLAHDEANETKSRNESK